MKKEMTLGYAHIDNPDEREIVEMVADAVRMPQQWLRKYYSAIIGRNISNRLAWLITRSQLALIAVILLAPPSTVLGLAAAGWFALSIVKCKKEL